MDGAIVVDREVTRILRAATQLVPDPSIETERVRHPAPHRRAGRQADRLPGHLGEPVDADHRPLRRRPAARARGVRRDPVPGQPGAGDPRAVQAAARRGHRHPVGARDRGPGHRPRRRRPWSSGWRWCAGSATEIAGYVVELGTDGRLLTLQLDELIGGVGPDRELVDPRLPRPATRRERTRRRACSPSSASSPPTELLDLRRSPGRSASASSATRSTPRSARTATGC